MQIKKKNQDYEHQDFYDHFYYNSSQDIWCPNLTCKKALCLHFDYYWKFGICEEIVFALKLLKFKLKIINNKL